MYSRVGGGVDAGISLKHDDPVSQVGGHDEIVLHNKSRLLGVEDEPEMTQYTLKSVVNDCQN